MIINLLILFASHCYADFPCQGEFVTRTKTKDIYMLLVHCAIYTVAVAFGFFLVAFSNGTLSHMDWSWTMAVLFYSHFIIDLIKCRFRNKLHNGKVSEIDVDFDAEDDELREKDILLFYADQFMHVCIIFSLYMSMVV
jgi:hypothetical protein